MHQDTYVFSGMEKLARKDRAAVVYPHITPVSRGHYSMACVPVCTDAGDLPKGGITQRYIELLTHNTREEPYGWLWTHKTMEEVKWWCT